MAHVKTAISLPEEVFRRFDELARLRGEPRSVAISRALEKYLYDLETRQMMDDLNAEADALTDEEREEDMQFLRRAARQIDERLRAEERRDNAEW